MFACTKLKEALIVSVEFSCLHTLGRALLVPFTTSEWDSYIHELLLFICGGSLDRGVDGSDTFPFGVLGAAAPEESLPRLVFSGLLKIKYIAFTGFAQA